MRDYEQHNPLRRWGAGARGQANILSWRNRERNGIELAGAIMRAKLAWYIAGRSHDTARGFEQFQLLTGTNTNSQ
jgi:hypothetical protein